MKRQANETNCNEPGDSASVPYPAMKPLKQLILKIRPTLSVFAVLYAIFVVQQFAARKVLGGDPAAVFHVVFWTLAPPLWFLAERWADPVANAKAVKVGKENEGKLW